MPIIEVARSIKALYLTIKKGQSGAHGREELPCQPEDPIKTESARIFEQKWDCCRKNKDYLAMKAEHRQRYQEVE
ncbi:hypothetical protein RCH20_000889 [Psychrobacter sp. PL15]|nr:hypothetical protein [Psychrobacter sp. PL15]